MKQRLAMICLAVICWTPAAAQEIANCGAPQALDDGWTIARPEEVGLDGATLCGLDGLLARWPQQNVHAVAVARHGKLVMERYFTGADQRFGRAIGRVAYGPTTLHDLRSISKSVTSLLIGIAIGEGKFPGLDTPVIDALPDYAFIRTDDNARVTLRHLLTMSAGWAWDEDRPYADPQNSETAMENAADPYTYVLQRPFVAAPGKVYAYNSGGSMLLGAVLARAVGRPIDAYAREKLFAPLGIADTEWGSFGRQTEPASYGGLRLRPRDSAKIGRLLLTDGMWGDRRVVPKGWVADSTQPRLGGDGLFFYGYQWWLGRSFFQDHELQWIAGVGYGGQRLYIVPDLDLVVMVNAGHYGGPLQGIIPLAIFRDLVLAAVKD